MVSEQLQSMGAQFVSQIPAKWSGWIRLMLHQRLLGEVKSYPKLMTLKQWQDFVRLLGCRRVVYPSHGPDIESSVLFVLKKEDHGIGLRQLNRPLAKSRCLGLMQVTSAHPREGDQDEHFIIERHRSTQGTCTLGTIHLKRKPQLHKAESL